MPDPSAAVPQWTDVLDGFCTDEFGVKTRQFHCCRRHGAARRRCFAQGPDAIVAAATEAPVPFVIDWEPSGELSFPPGEPTAANLGNICGLWGLRPGSSGSSSPPGRTGPHVRFRLRLERDYGRCCRNESLACAHKAVSDRGTWGRGGTQGHGRDPDVWGLGGGQGGKERSRHLGTGGTHGDTGAVGGM